MEIRCRERPLAALSPYIDNVLKSYSMTRLQQPKLPTELPSSFPFLCGESRVSLPPVKMLRSKRVRVFGSKGIEFLD